MEENILRKKLLDLLRSGRVLIKGKGNYSGNIARIDFKSETVNKNHEDSLVELKRIVKGLLGLGAAILFCEGARKVFGVLKAFGEAALATQDMAVESISLSNTSIEFNGYCLERGKKPPSSGGSLEFVEELGQYEEVDRFFAILNEKSDFWGFLEEFDSKAFLMNCVNSHKRVLKDDFLRLVFDQFSPSDEFLKTFDNELKKALKERITQIFIWKLQGDLTLSEMIDALAQKVNIPNPPLFTAHVSGKSIPCSLFVDPTFPPEFFIQKYLSVAREISSRPRLEFEKEGISSKLDAHIKKKEKELKYQMSHLLELERQSFVKKEGQYLDIVEKILNNEKTDNPS